MKTLDFSLSGIQLSFIPGIYFGTEGYARLSYCYSDEDLKEGLDRMERFIRGLPL